MYVLTVGFFEKKSFFQRKNWTIHEKTIGNLLNIINYMYTNPNESGENFSKNLCVKSVRIRSFSGPYFPAFRLNTEKYRPEKLRIWILFTQ